MTFLTKQNKKWTAPQMNKEKSTCATVDELNLVSVHDGFLRNKLSYYYYTKQIKQKWDNEQGHASLPSLTHLHRDLKMSELWCRQDLLTFGLIQYFCWCCFWSLNHESFSMSVSSLMKRNWHNLWVTKAFRTLCSTALCLSPETTARVMCDTGGQRWDEIKGHKL